MRGVSQGSASVKERKRKQDRAEKKSQCDVGLIKPWLARQEALE